MSIHELFRIFPGIFMAPDGASAGTGTSDGTQNTDRVDPPSAGGEPPTSNPGAAPSGDSATPRTFTQAEVDALLATNQQESFDKGLNMGFGKGADKAEKDAAEQPNLPP